MVLPQIMAHPNTTATFTQACVPCRPELRRFCLLLEVGICKSLLAVHATSAATDCYAFTCICIAVLITQTFKPLKWDRQAAYGGYSGNEVANN